MIKENYQIPQLIKEEDKPYFERGTLDLLNNKALVTSASFFKRVFDTDLYNVLKSESMTISPKFIAKLLGDIKDIKDFDIRKYQNVLDGFEIGKVKVSVELQYIFDLGNGFHCFCLEPREFERTFYVADYPKSEEKRKFIKSADMEFVVKAYQNIKLKYPYILEESDMNEVTILTEFNGVPYKCKIDKLYYDEKKRVMEVIDLKSVFFDFYAKNYKRGKDSKRWGLIKYIKELNYDLQGYCYTRAVRQYFDYHGYIEDGRITDVIFPLLLASKETFEVKKVTLGSELMESGEEKFNNIFPEIQSFFYNGYEMIEKDEVI